MTMLDTDKWTMVSAADVQELLDRCPRGKAVVYEASPPHIERYRVFEANARGTNAGGLECDEIRTFNGWMQLRKFGYARVYIL